MLHFREVMCDVLKYLDDKQVNGRIQGATRKSTNSEVFLLIHGKYMPPPTQSIVTHKISQYLISISATTVVHS